MLCKHILIISIKYGSAVVKLKPVNVGADGGILSGKTTPAFEISGKIGRGSGYGFARRGNGAYGANVPAGGIYQRRVTGYNQAGRVPGRPRRQYFVRMRTYRPTNPQTATQQANRSTFADAVAAWQVMDAAQRQPYIDRAVRKSRRGRNLFIQEFMLQS